MYIFWGAGKILQQSINWVDFSKVAAIADKNEALWGNEYNGVKVIDPNKINEYNFDYAVVFSKNNFEAIFRQLHYEMMLPVSKILSYKDLSAKVRDSADAWKREADEAFIMTIDKMDTVRIEGLNSDKIYLYGKEDYIVRRVRYGCIDASELEKCADMEIDNPWERLFIFRKEKVLYKQHSETLTIYVVTHKKFSMPPDDIYTPLQAGASVNKPLGYLRDDEGDNISELNPYINECTALYWIWKNSVSDYIGLNHYRRYFLRNALYTIDNIVDAECVYDLLGEYDIILAEKTYFNDTVAEALAEAVNPDAAKAGMKTVRRIIGQRHPEYMDAFNTVFNGFYIYKCNMFITDRKICDQYCEWLFSIIIDAAKEMDVSGYDAYSKRIAGFMAERLLTVWVVRQKLRIKELPVLVTE